MVLRMKRKATQAARHRPWRERRGLRPGLAAIVVLLPVLLLSSCAPDADGGGADQPLRADRPRHVVSLDLCADQYLFALADRDQIAALSYNADDPALSVIAGEVEGIRLTGVGIEELLRLKPDLVLVGPYQPQRTMSALKARNIAYAAIAADNDADDILANVELVARAVGQAERGKAVARQFRADLDALGTGPGAGRIAAYYQRRGYLTGAGTLVDDMMKRLGLANLASVEGRGVLDRMSVEEMAMARPDFLILEADSISVQDRGTEMLQHPVLRRAVPGKRQLVMPQALTVCGGLHYPRAIRALADQIRKADGSA